MKDELYHYGTPRHSGRYPWGSGENPYQHSDYFMATVNDLKKQGLTENEIMKTLGMSSTEYRKRKSLAKNQKQNEMLSEIMKLEEKGYSQTAIAEKLGVTEGLIRYYKRDTTKTRVSKINEVSDKLKDAVDNKGYIDVGKGNAQWMGIKDNVLNTSVQKLVDQGYVVQKVQIDQLGTADGNKTTIKVLCPPGTTYADVVTNIDKIRTIEGYVEKDGRTSLNLEKPVSISSDRVMIRYAEDGGKEKDGVIELRRGVDDISLKDARYAQVRIGVDDTHYLKGMAMYTDEKMPPESTLYLIPISTKINPKWKFSSQ